LEKEGILYSKAETNWRGAMDRTLKSLLISYGSLVLIGQKKSEQIFVRHSFLRRLVDIQSINVYKQGRVDLKKQCGINGMHGI
jgi:hypothetical protein